MHQKVVTVPEVAGVDWPGLSGDVPVGGSGVGQEDVAELLAALAHADHPLVVGGPGKVLDRAADGLRGTSRAYWLHTLSLVKDIL